MEEAEARKTAQTVGLAAIKYGDLSNQASKDYIFDVDRFTSFEGNTGPYILYTIVRIKSILAKYEETGGSLQGLKILAPAGDYEKALMLQVLKFNDVINTVYEETAPIRSVHIFMIWQMSSTSFTMRQRYLQRRTRCAETDIFPCLS